jgi:hypothetical protein
MIEVWKPIPSNPRYQVSSLGRVRSTKALRGGGKLVKICTSTKYYSCCLYFQGGGRKTRNIHSLVLETFVGEKPEGMVARHLDDDRSNNVVSNLCYGSYAENTADRRRNGGDCPGELNGNSRLTEAAVREIRSSPPRKKGEIIKLMKKYEVSRGAIADIRGGRSWRHVP